MRTWNNCIEAYKTIESDYLNLKRLPNPAEYRPYGILICINEDLYLLGGIDGKFLNTIEKYDSTTNRWEVVATVYDEPCCQKVYANLCACNFMGKIYIFGRFHLNDNYFLVFDPSTNTLNKIVSGVYVKRGNAACVVHKDRIFLSGGHPLKYARSVKYYDPCCNEWTDAPNMVEERHLHASVSIKNKLFMIGGSGSITCEVFEKTAFCLIKSSPFVRSDCDRRALAVGNKIVLFRGSSLFHYDVDSEEWSKDDSVVKLGLICAVKIPHMF